MQKVGESKQSQIDSNHLNGMPSIKSKQATSRSQNAKKVSRQEQLGVKRIIIAPKRARVSAFFPNFTRGKKRPAI
jgi:hypothetical protein